MKVSFLMRPDGGLFFGGAEVQALQTAQALNQYGVQAQVLTPETREVGDVVHAFGMYASYLTTQQYCLERGIPFVLSTIFYRDHRSWLDKLHDRVRIRRRNNRLWAMKKLMAGSRVLLPNTVAEAQMIADLFGEQKAALHVVPNGAEDRFAEANPSLFRERTGIARPFVLNVGRVEQRKNQLRLIQALVGSGLPLVIVGKQTEPAYYQACKLAAHGDPNIHFFDAVDHDDPFLASAYAAAKVFALPSLLETPGIAAIEAGLAGARVVVTPVGGAREYFAEHAHYVHPLSVADIGSQIRRAWDAPDDGGQLRQHLLQRYTWAAVAQLTHQAYVSVLQGSGARAGGRA